MIRVVVIEEYEVTNFSKWLSEYRSKGWKIVNSGSEVASYVGYIADKVRYWAILERSDDMTWE